MACVCVCACAYERVGNAALWRKTTCKKKLTSFSSYFLLSMFLS